MKTWHSAACSSAEEPKTKLISAKEDVKSVAEATLRAQGAVFAKANDSRLDRYRQGMRLLESYRWGNLESTVKKTMESTEQARNENVKSDRWSECEDAHRGWEEAFT